MDHKSKNHFNMSLDYVHINLPFLGRLKGQVKIGARYVPVSNG